MIRSSLALIVALGICGAPHARAAAHDAPPAPNVPERRATAAETAKGIALFRAKIRPLLTQHCLDCHGGRKTRGDFDARTREAFVSHAHKGVPIIPFNAAQSRLTAMIQREKKHFMPPKYALSAQEIADLKAWIDLGAPFDGPLVTRAPGAW